MRIRDLVKQTYHQAWCYSLKADPFTLTPLYLHGIGHFVAGSAPVSTFDLPTLTGYADSPPVFFPINALTPTSRV